MRQVLTAIETGQLRAVSSVITLAEVLTCPLRDGNENLAARYRKLLVESGHLQLVPIDAHVAARATALRAEYGLRTPDALQVAVAQAAGSTPS